MKSEISEVELKKLISDFLDILTENQLLTFSLYYGLNEKCIHAKIGGISSILELSRSTVNGYLKTVHKKLSNPRFRPILEALNSEN